MTREQAINYLFSSGFTNEQVGEVVRALTYEPTTKNDPKFCPDRKAKTTNMETILHCIENECVAYKDGKCLKYNSDQEPTTKNNLGVDCISRDDVRDVMQELWGTSGELLDRLMSLPSVTPQLSVPEVTALAEWTEKLTKASEDAYNKGYADGMKAQDKNCSDCEVVQACIKTGIRSTSKALSILDKIRAEIDQYLEIEGFGSEYRNDVKGIIDKYKAESEDNNE